MLQVMMPSEDRPGEGNMQVNVELTTLSSLDMRQGRPSDVPSYLTQQV